MHNISEQEMKMIQFYLLYGFEKLNEAAGKNELFHIKNSKKNGRQVNKVERVYLGLHKRIRNKNGKITQLIPEQRFETIDEIIAFIKREKNFPFLLTKKECEKADYVYSYLPYSGIDTDGVNTYICFSNYGCKIDIL